MTYGLGFSVYILRTYLINYNIKLNSSEFSEILKGNHQLYPGGDPLITLKEESVCGRKFCGSAKWQNFYILRE